MSEQPPEDPAAHASAKIASYISVIALAAEAYAQVAASRARERAVADERAAGALRAERRAAYGQARLGWSSILNPKTWERATVVDAGTAWAHAQAWRPDPEAERANHLAEDRLRELRPDVMERYDRLRTQGADPVDAMRRVAPSFDRPPARPGQPAPQRDALSADIGTSTFAADEATGPAREGAGDSTVAQDRPRPAADVVLAGAARAPAVIAADGYPQPLTAVNLNAGRAAARQTAVPDAVQRSRTQTGTARGR